ncbi:CapA family protein [Aeromicrobium camelliae]|uniref:CapA family protein n=1 Tax=Aeromicrobium camelliae TaxID=1538144 RepID=A0A3N6X822_9ACTN|nr:CapA family protein [Aeromicrobium camelliae]RQN09778.1 CapA family protein [Aeromicrobium camelliae]
MTRLALLVTLVALLAGCTSAPEPAPSPEPPSHRLPLAIATSLSRPPLDLDAAEARRLVAGEIETWEPLSGQDEPLRVVRTDEALDAVLADDTAVALVPADRVRPTVRLATVDGLDPLDDEDYPLTIPSERPLTPHARVLVGGDVMLGRRVGAYLARRGDLGAVWGDIGSVLADADVAFVNLESTLSTAGPPQQGGDSFGADPGVLAGMRAAGIDVVGLANNHLGDFGAEPMLTTFRLLREAGFAVVGAGEDRARAREPAIVDTGSLRVGFYATDSIGETPAAGPASPGTNRIDAPPRTGPAIDQEALRRAVEDIGDLAGRVDLLVVVPHWGTQYTNVPEPSQREMARAFTDAGADVVVGGHPHWVQGWEQHDDATVVHSLGNLVFDMDFMRETQEGILVEIIATPVQVLDVRPLPYVIDETFTPRLVEGERAAAILELARRASSPPFDAGLR